LTVPAADDGAVGPSPVMTVDGQAFALEAVEKDASMLRVPRAAIEPLKDGLRMELFPDGRPADGAGGIVFSLRGSRVAIDAAENRCSPRDMSAYQAVTFTPYSSYINLVKELREDDIRAFAKATASQPELAAAMVELDEGRRLLFTRLCGSSWYYGRSGCNITGFAPDGTGGSNGRDGKQTAQDAADAEIPAGVPSWRVVYDSENVRLYTDPRSAPDGWRDLVTLPVGGGAGLFWRWNGKRYALVGELDD
jgi:hypothetical protein